jgi:hypothetical protein
MNIKRRAIKRRAVKRWFVHSLVGIYPASWRQEYGAELTDVLMADPLSVAIVSDVVWSGARQRLRSLDLATELGLGAMFVILAMFVWNIMVPQTYGNGSAWTTVLEPSHITFPSVRIAPLVSALYVAFLLASGCAIHLRQGTSPARSGLATMKICIIAVMPIMAVGILMQLGLMHAIVLGPGDVPTTFREHGFAFSYYAAGAYGAGAAAPTPMSVFLAPLSRLGESWIWGTLGGALGRTISRRRTRAGASPEVEAPGGAGG